MATPLTRLVPALRRLAAPAESDATLLGRFVRERDEIAFTSLVDRHRPMVLHVCRRVLGDPHAAEDACQATFLVLARKATAVGRPARLGLSCRERSGSGVGRRHRDCRNTISHRLRQSHEGRAGAQSAHSQTRR